MKMGKKELFYYDEWTEDSRSRFQCFWRTLCEFSEEEVMAITKEIDMTDEIFLQSILTCIYTDNLNWYEEILEDFPEHAKALLQKIEKDKACELLFSMRKAKKFKKALEKYK